MEISTRTLYKVGTLKVTIISENGKSTAYVEMPELDFNGDINSCMNRLADLRDGISQIINEAL